MFSNFLRVAQLTRKESGWEHEPCMTPCPMIPSLGQGTRRGLQETLGPIDTCRDYAETLSSPQENTFRFSLATVGCGCWEPEMGPEELTEKYQVLTPQHWHWD